MANRDHGYSVSVILDLKITLRNQINRDTFNKKSNIRDLVQPVAVWNVTYRPFAGILDWVLLVNANQDIMAMDLIASKMMCRCAYLAESLAKSTIHNWMLSCNHMLYWAMGDHTPRSAQSRVRLATAHNWQLCLALQLDGYLPNHSLMIMHQTDWWYTIVSILLLLFICIDFFVVQFLCA